MANKRRKAKAYQTAYGEVLVERHVYQKGGGGKTYCPLKRNARIVVTSTPLFAKQISSKIAYGSAREVEKDLLDNHGRRVALSYIQRLSEAVGSIVQAKEESETYEVPEMDHAITTVAVGLDGTCMLICVRQDGEKRWWEQYRYTIVKEKGNTPCM